jgi:hypothetical protein
LHPAVAVAAAMVDLHRQHPGQLRELAAVAVQEAMPVSLLLGHLRHTPEDMPVERDTTSEELMSVAAAAAVWRRRARQHPR